MTFWEVILLAIIIMVLWPLAPFLSMIALVTVTLIGACVAAIVTAVIAAFHSIFNRGRR